MEKIHSLFRVKNKVCLILTTPPASNSNNLKRMLFLEHIACEMAHALLLGNCFHFSRARNIRVVAVSQPQRFPQMSGFAHAALKERDGNEPESAQTNGLNARRRCRNLGTGEYLGYGRRQSNVRSTMPLKAFPSCHRSFHRRKGNYRREFAS